MATMQDGYVALPLHAVEREELSWIEKGGESISNGCARSRGEKAGAAGEGAWLDWVDSIPSSGSCSSSAVPFGLHASADVAGQETWEPPE